ncbi:MAG: hypothetical protein HC785_24490 [Calothrix sp. CSU_2_0]|nr:hypothetical protein [Calothrix sp. CSU_2_0]
MGFCLVGLFLAGGLAGEATEGIEVAVGAGGSGKRLGDGTGSGIGGKFSLFVQ